MLVFQFVFDSVPYFLSGNIFCRKLAKALNLLPPFPYYDNTYRRICPSPLPRDLVSLDGCSIVAIGKVDLYSQQFLQDTSSIPSLPHIRCNLPPLYNVSIDLHSLE